MPAYIIAALLCLGLLGIVKLVLGVNSNLKVKGLDAPSDQPT